LADAVQKSCRWDRVSGWALNFPTTIRVRGTGETGKSQHEKLSQCFQTNAIEWIFTAEVGIGWISFSFEKREGLDAAS
jgi:hypothetical protein